MQDREVRTFPFVVEEVRDAENGRSEDKTVKGHAAVTGQWADLGPFRERIAKGAFDEVLSRSPHVLHLWDHDTSKVLSSTRSNPVTLELSTDPRGLRFWSRIDGGLSYAKDLFRLLERGIVNQSSFAFTVAKDEWKERTLDGETIIERTIIKIAELFDVTTTAQGAYPQADSQIAMRTRQRAREISEGLPDSRPADTEDAAQSEAVETDPPPDTGAGSEGSTTAQEPPVAREDADLRLLKRRARRALAEAKELQEQVRKVVPSYEDYGANRGGPQGP